MISDERHWQFGLVRLSYYSPVNERVDCALRVSTPGGSSMWRSDDEVEGGWLHLGGRRRIDTTSADRATITTP